MQYSSIQFGCSKIPSRPPSASSQRADPPGRLTVFPRGHSMNYFRFAPILILAAGVFGSGAVMAQSPAAPQANKPEPPAVIKSFDLSAIDKTADPCTDFYQYSCGNWVNRDRKSTLLNSSHLGI